MRGRFFWLPALVVLALCLFALPGCKNRFGGQLPEASGEVIKAKAEPQGFDFVRAFTEQADGKTVLAVEFSRPLNGKQDFNSLLTFKETLKTPGGWVLGSGGEGAENRVLRYSPVEPDTQYTLKIKGDLAATDGKTLGKDREESVFSGDVAPSIGFASQGSVLPAKDSRGLPVISMNVNEVDVEFLRVPEKSLPRFFAEYRSPAQRDAWEIQGDDSNGRSSDDEGRNRIGNYAESVFASRFALDAKRNQRAVNYLPIQDIKQLQQPGLYFAVMRRQGNYQGDYQTTFYTVSDIGLHARAYRDKLFVHTASLANGKALSGVALRILDKKGNPLVDVKTDGNGNALLNYALDAEHVLLATQGDNVSALPFNQPALDLSEFDVGGRGQASFEVFPWAGRDLYRPGEIVGISALLRDADGRMLDNKGGAAPPLYVRLKQPNGKPFLETKLEANPLGYYRFERLIPPDAATGNWSVEFRLDPASKDAASGMKLHIEEFLPERMKLELDAPATVKAGQPLPLKVQGSYLYGAPAADNRFTAKLALAHEPHPVPKLEKFFFGDPTLKLPKPSEDVVDAKLDADGKLSEDVELPSETPAGTPLKVVVSGSLYETGGRSVDRVLVRTLLPADVLVGVRPLFDAEEGSGNNTDVSFEVTRVAADGSPRPQAGLQVKLTRERREYHWNHEEGSGWRFDYSSRFEVVKSQTLDAGNAPVKLSMPVEWGDYRLEITDPQTGLTSRYPFTAGWSWRDDNRGPDSRPDKVKLALDKPTYKAGDTLKVTVTPPEAGKGLLLVESDKLIYVQEIDAKPGSTFEIPVSPDWERHDVYITALVFRGGSASSKITPARAVGEAHVPMGRDARKLAVAMVVPEMQRPETRMPVTVAAPQLAGQQAFVVVTATDVGITNITRWPIPDPFKHFFDKRRLGVDAYDIYGRVIESFEGAMAKLRYGGDAVVPLSAPVRPMAKVKTVDLYAAPVQLDAKGIARLQVPLPDFNGTLRVNAVVYSADRFGVASKETVVRAPIVAEPSMPRVLAPSDSSQVTLDVSNFTGKQGDFAVSVSGEGPVTVSGSRSISLAPGKKATLTFPVAGASGYGVGKVRVKVEGNGFHVDRSYDLPVRAAWPGVLRTRGGEVAAGESVRFDPAISEGLLDGSINARMVVSVLPPLPFASALEGALHYPYGCAEQTTGKGYAALILDPATARALGVQKVDPSTRATHMEAALGRLASMQAGNGHYTMWGGENSDVNPMLTPYIAEFLLDAREGGFAIPEAMLQKSLERLSDDLLTGGGRFSGSSHADHMHFAYVSYAGYVLARVNRAPLGALRNLYDNNRGEAITGLPLVRLGIALTLQGDRARGQKAIAEGLAKPWPDKNRDIYFEDYATPIRDLAMMQALLHERGMAPAGDKARFDQLGKLLDERRDSGWLWLSTQEQNAIARTGKALLRKGAGNVAGEWRVGGQTFPATAGVSVARNFTAAELRSGVSFVPSAGGEQFVSWEVAGVPLRMPAATSPDFKISRTYYTLDGKVWNGGSLKQGETLIARVEMESKVSMPDALLTELLPAGLEVENMNLGDQQAWGSVVIDGVNMDSRGSAATLRNEEFRDDRYVAAVNLYGGSRARVFYLLRAVSPGTFLVPPPLLEDMYRPRLRAMGSSSVGSIRVVTP